MSFVIGEQKVLPRDAALTRTLRLEAAQALLGDTISISDDDWQHPSLLPGWTRAHVATHLAVTASEFAQTIETISANETLTVKSDDHLHLSDSEQAEVIERGSERNALQLQIDLDTSIGRLSLALDEAENLPPDTTVRLSEHKVIRLDLAPLARLNEIVLHHVDLDLGYQMKHLPETTARLLLEWNSFWIARLPSYPALELTSTSGFCVRLGEQGTPLEVDGPDNLLLGWLTGRISADQFSDKRLPQLPLF